MRRVVLLWRLLRDHNCDISKFKLWPTGSLEMELLVKDYIADDPMDVRKLERFARACDEFAACLLGEVLPATERFAGAVTAFGQEVGKSAMGRKL